MRPRRIAATATAAAALIVVACATPETEVEIPMPQLEGMEPQVERSFREARRAVVAEPGSAASWGRFGMIAHAHELWPEALAAYVRAEKLDPDDVRWPYYRGHVLSVVATDLAAAAQAFRRTLELRPGYAPAHMRLGQVLVASGEADAAATELTMALEISPELEPARLALAQVRLAQGRLDESARLLETLLDRNPRHRQALTTLGQVTMRLGRPEEARELAERARGAAQYSLFSDPLMEPVVSEGASSLLTWERAKAFLDNGNYEQAVLGLERVVELRPDNADAHQQLAVAYGNLGDLHRSRQHLERAVALAPDRVDALLQLATVQLELADPAAAIPHLERILELEPGDPDAPWQLGRARLMAGDLAGALASFAAAGGVAGGEAPAWGRNEWGSALAQAGRVDEALEQFRRALAAEPENARSLFSIGLVLEGRGRVDEAVEHYCAAERLRPRSPAQARLQALGRSCPG